MYHAAAVVISNYTITLVNEGFKYLKEIGFTEETIIQMMLPLLKGTVQNIQKHGTAKGLTGPILRGDDGVIQSHIKCIKELGYAETEFYQLMGKKTLDMIQIGPDRSINYEN